MKKILFFVFILLLVGNVSALIMVPPTTYTVIPTNTTAYNQFYSANPSLANTPSTVQFSGTFYAWDPVTATTNAGSNNSNENMGYDPYQQEILTYTDSNLGTIPFVEVCATPNSVWEISRASNVDVLTASSGIPYSPTFPDFIAYTEHPCANGMVCLNGACQLPTPGSPFPLSQVGPYSITNSVGDNMWMHTGNVNTDIFPESISLTPFTLHIMDAAGTIQEIGANLLCGGTIPAGGCNYLGFATGELIANSTNTSEEMAVNQFLTVA